MYKAEVCSRAGRSPEETAVAHKITFLESKNTSHNYLAALQFEYNSLYVPVGVSEVSTCQWNEKCAPILLA